MYQPEKVKSGPDSKTLNSLRGTVSEPITTLSQKPVTKGQKVAVRLVEKGAGMVGLENWEENKEWAGIFNHIVKTARVATFLAHELAKTGESVNPRVILNTVLLSHAGRRQWDEANWYPQAVDGAQEKAAKGDQYLTSAILEDTGIPQVVLDTIEAHGMGTVYPIDHMNTWEKRISMYADFRVSQGISSLDERFVDLQDRAVVSGRLTQEQLNQIKVWAVKTEEEIFSKIQMKPEDITEHMPVMPRWEQYIRRLYINDAEQGIFERMSQINDQIRRGEATQEQIDAEFPVGTWWGRYTQELFIKQKGVPFIPTGFKQRGIARAIEFYQWLESSDLNGKAQKLPKAPTHNLD